MSYRDSVFFHYELGNKVFGKKENSFLGEIPLHKLQNRSPIKGTAQFDFPLHIPLLEHYLRESTLVKIHILERYKHCTHEHSWTCLEFRKQGQHSAPRLSCTSADLVTLWTASHKDPINLPLKTPRFVDEFFQSPGFLVAGQAPPARWPWKG